MQNSALINHFQLNRINFAHEFFQRMIQNEFSIIFNQHQIDMEMYLKSISLGIGMVAIRFERAVVKYRDLRNVVIIAQQKLRQQKRHIIKENRINDNVCLISSKMVKVKTFCGAVFSPQDYQILLKNNIQHLEHIPMTKTFNTAEMIANGKLSPQQRPFFYIYRQIYRGHTSYGILGEISIQDYHDNNIKRHEKTLHRAHLTHETYKMEHVGPVVVGYRQDLQLKSMIINLTKQKVQLSGWTTCDGREHTLWRIQDEKAALSSRFNAIDNLYILDGHHRMKAAHQNYLLSDKVEEKDCWIQALLISSDDIVVHSQHRVIQNIPQSLNIRAELSKLQQIEITDLGSLNQKDMQINEQLLTYEIILKEFDYYYGINFKNPTRNVLEKVTSVRLQSEIFKAFFDEMLFKEIKYVPGIIEQDTINKHDVVFFVRQPEIETLFEIADENVTMPPKSTWIEPKPCSHMVIRLV